MCISFIFLHSHTRLVFCHSCSTCAGCHQIWSIVYCHCSHSMQIRVSETVGHPSVSPSHYSHVACSCGEFAAVGPAGRRYQLIAARPTPSSSMVLSSKCDQCHIYSRRRRLNTDLLTVYRDLHVHHVDLRQQSPLACSVHGACICVLYT